MSTALSFVGSTLPDAFVGVPYVAGIPSKGVSTTFATCSVIAGALPLGLSVAGMSVPVVTGTVQQTSQTGGQVDGSYSFTISLGDAATITQVFTMNVHYLPSDQDQSVTAQAAIRAGEQLDNTGGTAGGVSESGDFPGPTVPTDIG
jgi:hypothetical protein